MKIQLIKPSIDNKEDALDFRNEFFENNEKIINGSEMLDNISSYETWLESVTANANPETVSSEWVLTDTYFAVDETGKIVGIADLRHELKGFLADFGHAGYSVRPSERRKGYATGILALVIQIAKENGMDALQLSVERTNEASVRTILKNGGKYERSFEFEGEAADVYRIML